MMEDNRANLDYQEDSAAPDSVVSAGSLMATSSNSNVFDANDSMALNESSIQNVLKDSAYRNSAFPTQKCNFLTHLCNQIKVFVNSLNFVSRFIPLNEIFVTYSFCHLNVLFQENWKRS